MVRLERPGWRNSDIRRLLFGEVRQLHSKFVEVQSCNLFVEMLGKDVNFVAVLIGLGEKFNLGEHLIGEARTHDEAWMSGRISKIHKPSLGQER